MAELVTFWRIPELSVRSSVVIWGHQGRLGLVAHSLGEATGRCYQGITDMEDSAAAEVGRGHRGQSGRIGEEIQLFPFPGL